MSKIAYDLKKIKAIVFDVDGVLSPSTVPLGTDGMPSRMVNIKDGFAMRFAAMSDIRIAIITGADSPAIVQRFKALGINDIYTKASMKLPILIQWMEANHLSPLEVAYVGDDIPDYECMSYVGLPVAPADAAVDIQAVARYVSPVAGGFGVARDIIEEVMRAHEKWMLGQKAFGW